METAPVTFRLNHTDLCCFQTTGSGGTRPPLAMRFRAGLPAGDPPDPFHRTYYNTLDRFAHGTNPQADRFGAAATRQIAPGRRCCCRLACWESHRRTRIALASYNLRLASRFNRRVQRLMSEPAYRDVFPATRLKTSSAKQPNVIRTSDEFELIGAPGGLLNVGREGALTGNPVDVFILDDLYKDAAEANSPLIRDHAWEWYNAVVKPGCTTIRAN